MIRLRKQNYCFNFSEEKKKQIRSYFAENPSSSHLRKSAQSSQALEHLWQQKNLGRRENDLHIYKEMQEAPKKRVLGSPVNGNLYL